MKDEKKEPEEYERQGRVTKHNLSGKVVKNKYFREERMSNRKKDFEMFATLLKGIGLMTYDSSKKNVI